MLENNDVDKGVHHYSRSYIYRSIEVTFRRSVSGADSIETNSRRHEETRSAKSENKSGRKFNLGTYKFLKYPSLVITVGTLRAKRFAVPQLRRR